MKSKNHIWMYSHKVFEETAKELTKVLPVIDCKPDPKDSFDEEVCLRPEKDRVFCKN